MEKMKTSLKGIELIKKYEGLELKAYKCPANVLTIGYGHTGEDVIEDMEITKDKALELLQKDLVFFENGVERLVEQHLTQGQFDALVSFSYNLGLGNLRSSTLLKKVNVGDYKGAAKEFEKWIYANSKKLNGLIKRRADERKLFESEDI